MTCVSFKDQLSWGMRLEDAIMAYTRTKQCTLEVSSGVDDGADIFWVLRIPLRIGAALGLIPIQGIFTMPTHQLKFSWIHWRTALTTVLLFGVGSNVLFITDQFINILTDTQRQSASELVFSFSGVWFYTAGTTTYLFFFCRSAHLPQFFEKWVEVNRMIHRTMSPDATLFRHVMFITVVILGSCFGENIMFHFHKMHPVRRARIMELTANDILMDYYEANSYMCAFFEYQPIVALALLIFNKLTLYAWNFGDVFLIVLSRVIYGRFEGINKYLERSMTSQANGGSMIKPGIVCWRSLRLNFLSVIDLLEDANRIFAPLIWLSFVTNIFFVCNQLYIQLAPSTPSDSLVSSIYVCWSFLHLIMRTLGVNVMAVNVNESARRTQQLLQHCIPEEYNEDVRRLEQYLLSNEIGLTGNGCFVITRSFILKICSAIFTLEVVLLQNSSIVV